MSNLVTLRASKCKCLQAEFKLILQPLQKIITKLNSNPLFSTCSIETYSVFASISDTFIPKKIFSR